ncbi:MAG: hypothetical protein RSE00_00450 [Clostridia bacterium]
MKCYITLSETNYKIMQKALINGDDYTESTFFQKGKYGLIKAKVYSCLAEWMREKLPNIEGEEKLYPLIFETQKPKYIAAFADEVKEYLLECEIPDEELLFIDFEKLEQASLGDIVSSSTIEYNRFKSSARISGYRPDMIIKSSDKLTISQKEIKKWIFESWKCFFETQQGNDQEGKWMSIVTFKIKGSYIKNITEVW